MLFIHRRMKSCHLWWLGSTWRRHCAKWIKPDTERQISQNFMYEIEHIEVGSKEWCVPEAKRTRLCRNVGQKIQHFS
jgi:hypothetical protein